MDTGERSCKRVAMRSILVANQKRLEAMAVQTQIAQKEAEIKVTEAPVRSSCRRA